MSMGAIVCIISDTAYQVNEQMTYGDLKKEKQIIYLIWSWAVVSLDILNTICNVLWSPDLTFNVCKREEWIIIHGSH